MPLQTSVRKLRCRETSHVTATELCSVGVTRVQMMTRSVSGSPLATPCRKTVLGNAESWSGEYSVGTAPIIEPIRVERFEVLGLRFNVLSCSSAFISGKILDNGQPAIVYCLTSFDT